MDVEELINYYGYPAESHTIQTEDGYLLTLHRIPHGKAGPTGGHRPVVFLQHAILLSSAAWVITGPDDGLAFILADAGYDVWMGNCRGNTYSRGHISKPPDSMRYWDFSWHEMARYDLTAGINYALKKAHRRKLTYVGHATGANMFYIMCSLRPEYNSRIDAQFSLAPDAIFDTHLEARSGDGHFIRDEIVRFNGYPSESHSVQTEDGYLLTLHRIPHGKAGPTDGDRPAVFLQHAIMLSSAAWVINGPNDGLAFLLADAGYDVWLGNSRGNTYSIGHIDKSPSSFVYWDFSMHEMAKYDFPAEIDYILEWTKQEKLTFIGHSTGANMFYIMCSLRPEYNSKIDAHISMAPDAILTPGLSAKESLERAIRLLGASMLTVEGNEILTNSRGRELNYPSECLVDPLSPLCQSNFFILSGFQDNDFDNRTWTMVEANFPAGTSYKTILHYSQCVLKEKYAEMDYGVFNYVKYKNRPPPEYNLTMVNVPVYFYYSKNDDISTKDEVDILQKTFPQAQEAFEVPSETFTHLDFLWGKNVKEQLYDDLLKLVNTIQGKSESGLSDTNTAAHETVTTPHDGDIVTSNEPIQTENEHLTSENELLENPQENQSKESE
ncbi:gastric triacylglycerol lipase-like [Hetaerina americana]|uniref:gastric triacylglycerol lipase-like n=1 Tax=Hetaerina americana TaxID=62018 RepID=UPI003A7F372E